MEVSSSFYDNDDDDKNERPSTVVLVPCKFCGKSFIPRLLEKHQTKCPEDVDSGYSDDKKDERQKAKAAAAASVSTDEAVSLTEEEIFELEESNSKKKMMGNKQRWRSESVLSNRTVVINKGAALHNGRRRGSSSVLDRRSKLNKTANNKGQRPTTAVLLKPKVLDESLKDKIDMSMTKKQFMSALKICDKSNLMALRKKVDEQTRPRQHIRGAIGFKKSGEGIGGGISQVE